MPVETVTQEAAAATKSSFSAIAGDTIALYGLQGTTYLLPIITLGYLARVMGPKGLGLVAYGQAVGGYLNLLIEYGFHFTLTREVARNRSNPARLSELLSVVWCAKGVLCLVALPILAGIWMIGNEHDVRLGASIFVWSAAQSLNLLWYFHGVERVRFASLLDMTSKFTSMVAIVLLVKRADQIALVFNLQAAAALLVLLISIRVAYRGKRLTLPKLPQIGNVLRLGWPVFLQRGSSAFYASINVVILQNFASSVAVGLYSGADRVVRGAANMLTPLLYSAYPRVSHLAKESPARGANIAAITIAITAVIGAAETAFLYLFNPHVVRILLGKGFEGTVPIMSILALLPFLGSLTTSLALQGLLPFGYERALAVIYGATSVGGILAASLVAGRWGAIGTAWVAVSVETSILISQVLVLHRSRTNLLQSFFSPETFAIADAGLRKLMGRA